jgi:hypothetical protein
MPIRNQAKAAAQSPGAGLKEDFLLTGPSRRGFPIGILALATLAACAAAISTKAQGTLNFISTGSGQTLASRDELLQTTPPAQAIAFDFGFATDEIAAPGQFLDSFTVTLSGPNAFSALLATIDASGAAWAPPGSGGFSDLDIQRTSIPATSLPPVLGRGSAFSVQVPIPSGSAGSALHLTFDLFDNLDNQMSSGWYGNVRIVAVPEPGCVLLLGFGLASIVIFKSRRA